MQNNYLILLNLRKATLPIEAEMNSDGADDGGFYQSEDNEREQICSEMKKLKEARKQLNVRSWRACKRLKIITRGIMSKNVILAKNVLWL